MWFSGWDRIGDIGLMALVIYVALVVMVRISGKRTTAQMNNFDWVITVAIGGLVSAGVLQQSVAVADALTGIAALLGLQWITTTLVIRSRLLSKAVKAQPMLLVRKGELLDENMRRERVSEEEIHAALREDGLLTLKDAAWVILETDGSFSILRHEGDDRETEPDLLNDVAGRP